MKRMIRLIITIFIFICFVDNVHAETLKNIYEIKPTTKCTISRDLDNNVRPMQGVYFFDHYAVYAGYQSDTDPAIITLVDLDTCTILDKNNDVVMGHANDITYNSQDDKFYVTSCSSDKKIYGFKIVNNRIVHDSNPITMNFVIGAFSYSSEDNRYYSYSDGVLYTFDSLLSSSQAIKLGTTPIYYDNFENGTTKLVTQGISSDGNNIYFARTISERTSAYYNDSFVLVFDNKTGDYKYAMHFPSSYFSGHLEGVTVVNNRLYFGINVHTSPTNQTFLYYDNIDQIEEEYNSSIKSEGFVNIDTPIYIHLNDDFPFSEIKYKIIYNNNVEELVELNESNCTVTGFDNTKIGEQEVIVKYKTSEIKVKINVLKEGEEVPETIVNDDGEQVKVPNTNASKYILLIVTGLILIIVGVFIIINNLNKKQLKDTSK